MAAKSSFYATTGPEPDQVETLADLIAQAEAAQAAAEAAQAAAEAAATEAEEILDDVVFNADTSTVDMQFVVDEDNMASDSATKIPTQQSVKAYVDASAGGGGGTGNVIVLENVSGADTITANAVGTPITEYVTGGLYILKAASTNTGAATINIDSVGAVALKKYGSALGVGDSFANTWYAYMFDGTDMQMILSGAML